MNWRVVTEIKGRPTRRSLPFRSLSAAFVEVAGQVALLGDEYDLTPAGGGCSIWKKGVAERVGDLTIEGVKAI